MTKYREILRLQSLGFSERNIAQSCGVSRNTVARVLKKAAEINISWPLDFDMTDSALEELMFPRDKSATNKRMPDFNYIRKELLRNGVNKKSDWYTTSLNTTYHEMAEHYNLAIIPARVRKPKDKPNVEGSVGKISTWITAALRNEQFFSLAELNDSIREKLNAYNARKFQKKECSRLSLFLGEEMPLLAPLPATPFELAEWKQATVQFNYHIAVDKMYYSVPYQYIKNKVDVRITDTTVEIFYNHNRIASHRRLHGRSGQYSTVTEHMPQEHQKYLEWNGDRFRKWADSIGINTSKVVDAILTSGRGEQQSYRSCMGLLKLAEKYSPEKLEQVCAKALSYSAKPSYKSIKNLLAAMKDSSDDISNASKESQTVEKPHGITRGARYYGGKRS